MSEREINCRYTSEIVCPHCGHEFRDSWDYHLEGSTTLECTSEECGKEFFVEPVFTVEYVSEKLEDRTPEGRARKLKAMQDAMTKRIDDLLA